MTRIEARGATEHGEAVTVAFELDEPCEQGCGGRGMVTHPLWVEFNEADERIRRELGVGYSVSAEHRAWEREWWRERGYTVTVDVGFDRALPPLDVPCEVCDGYGTLLTDSGRELVRFIERSEGRR